MCGPAGQKSLRVTAKPYAVPRPYSDTLDLMRCASHLKWSWGLECSEACALHTHTRAQKNANPNTPPRFACCDPPSGSPTCL